MKRKFIIYGSALFIVLSLNYAAQAQQQKKPSERSFRAEMEKVKHKQAERNELIRNTQQPSENTAVVNSNNIITNTPVTKTPASPASKPSAGKMRPPRKQ